MYLKNYGILAVVVSKAGCRIIDVKFITLMLETFLVGLLND